MFYDLKILYLPILPFFLIPKFAMFEHHKPKYKAIVNHNSLENGNQRIKTKATLANDRRRVSIPPK